MVAAVNGKDAMNLQTRIARRGRCAFGAIRPKNDLRKTRALENLFVHFPIAAIVAGLAAGGVKCDFTSHLAGSWVVSNHTPQKSERTLDRMKVAAELDIRAGSRWIALDRIVVATLATASLARRGIVQARPQGPALPRVASSLKLDWVSVSRRQ